LSIPGRAAKPDVPPQPAAVPLFRDPIHDGAADPVVVWNRARKTWWMLYTNRRADLADSNGVTWVHGTHIGIAESADGGAHWKYVSEADIPLPAPDYTLWAPEVIDVGGTYHMFLTVVPGTFDNWNHPRHILHLTSKDLLHWKPLENVNLASETSKTFPSVSTVATDPAQVYSPCAGNEPAGEKLAVWGS
jgi:sucrose-6-phosphate hydrolase SacC (GH32 family)